MNFLCSIASNLIKGPVPGDAGGEGAPTEISDAELVDRCKEGDYGAFDLLVTKHRRRVYAMIQNMIKNEADSWDLAQEVFDYHDGPPWYAAPKNAAKKPLSPKSPKKKAKKAD